MTTRRDEAVPVGEPDDDVGGDPVCWLDRVCPDCGLFLTDHASSTCPRCGSARTGDVRDRWRARISRRSGTGPGACA
ncbi:hypothetical protein FXW78_37675 [Rhodococcus opacus]|nr:hypothetical protein [Rhodococcus opacus]